MVMQPVFSNRVNNFLIFFRLILNYLSGSHWLTQFSGFLSVPCVGFFVKCVDHHGLCEKLFTVAQKVHNLLLTMVIGKNSSKQLYFS